ncbi:AEC family transporter [Szabonella alba]|uniref:AEC family transporter n=1 Tax=Szabonella alba TaxID=2804194 RepID=A0A8K0Y0D0_9RHOB|nr:AEC family transporter [Szabonella alba]MBL4918060.1 AEC family transporter [Szabonella alba]
MGTIAAITLPIFAIVALGWGTVRSGLFSGADMRIIGRFVINIALPALLFNALASRNPAEIVNPLYLALYAGASVATLLVALVWFRRVQGLPLPEAGICVMGTSCANSGYFAFPILALAVPETAPAVLAMGVMVENLVMIPLCLILIAAGSERPGGKAALVLHIARDLLRRPLTIAMAAGLVWASLALPVPEVLDRVTGMLSTASVPLALFVIGGSLAGVTPRGDLARASQIATAKLILHPAMALAGLGLVAALGLTGLDPALRISLLVTTAVPMIGVYPIFAQEQGLERLASLALLLATAASFLTLSGVLALLL